MQQPCRRSSDERVKIMYADGEVEEWPITVVEAERMRRRPCARLQGQTAAYLWRKLRAQPFWSAEECGDSVRRLCEDLEAQHHAIAREAEDLLRRTLFPLADSSDPDNSDEEEGDGSGSGQNGVQHGGGRSGDGGGGSVVSGGMGATNRHAHSAAAHASGQGAGRWCGQTEGLHTGVWQKFELWHGARKVDRNCLKLPFLASLLERHANAPSGSPIMLDAPGRVYLSLMLPGTHVLPHSGPSNHRLRLHLPLIMPSDERPQPFIVVRGQRRKWQVGRCFIFDDSFEHAVNYPSAQEGQRSICSPDVQPKKIHRPTQKARAARGHQLLDNPPRVLTEGRRSLGQRADLSSNAAFDFFSSVRLILVVDIWHPQASESLFPLIDRSR
uniref:Aspartyl/asparaginy/proline hydroxylase domain-containing protein n=2 Tax=Chrysotila carterae TaxID=13221 RepID=A0A7S4BCH2_CHRCT